MLILVHIAVVAAFVVRVLLRPHRDPQARIAWIVVILALPVIGILAYLLVGETNIGRGRLRRVRQVKAALPAIADVPGLAAPAVCSPAASPTFCPDGMDDYAAVFAIGRSISGFPPVGGNRARLMADSDASIDAMVDDIDAARAHVHLLFYIWLPDGNGTKVAEALMRAARRGVACRALVDDLGSRALVASPLWNAMAQAGVRLGRALSIGNPLLRISTGRIDLRNHRKIVVIDNRVTYCGSQNCADPAFLPKARYAPWVDAVIRFEGPVARQNQMVFAVDWMATVDEDLRAVLLEPLDPPAPGFAAQVVATGPTERHSAMPDMFETLIYAARRELFITTPYYVPSESMQAALCAAPRRGVRTTLVLPARNDDFAVAATSRSHYADLLGAGVRIHEYRAGLLHTKSLTVDGTLTLIGSANMDRRSFDLNFENNIVLMDPGVTAAMRERQECYLADCREVSADHVAAWSWRRRLWNNTVAVLGPLL